MLTKTQAIVLHSLKYGETRLIVDMFTRSQGRQSFIVSIPKSVKGKIKKQLFQPLTLLEIEYDLRPKLQLQKLSDVRLASPFSSIPFDPNKLSISLFIAEFLYYALRSEQRNEPLFDYIVNSIQWLDAQTNRFANFHLVFLMRLSRFLGFYPNLDHYQAGDYFDLRESVFDAYGLPYDAPVPYVASGAKPPVGSIAHLLSTAYSRFPRTEVCISASGALPVNQSLTSGTT